MTESVSITDSERKTKLREYKRKWAAQDRLKNPQRHLDAVNKYSLLNKEKILIRSRKYEAENREKRRAKNLSYYLKNKPRLLAYNKNYCQKTKDARRKSKRKSMARARLLKTNGHIAYILRNRVLSALNGTKKAASAISLLGCPIDLFRLYIQNQFRDGMAWNNHGTVWHIDHIKPCASFDLSKPENQNACFHYTNMQPLLVYENLKKGDRVYE